MEVGNKMKKLALYVHIPFCKQKCKYCDFNSFFLNDEVKIERYILALCSQIEYYADKSSEFEVTSVYFGGGTPSFINEKYIEQIINKIREKYNMAGNPEITIEANPGTVTLEKLKKYRSFGINRLSFGVQTLNDKLLKSIGRVHTAKCAVDGFNMARKAGFSNISLDIMFGLPGQELKDVEDTLNRFIELNPEHISAYSLKIEDNTEFGRLFKKGKLVLPSENEEREMYYLVKSKLKEHGYNQYEISNFSKPGFEAIHNTAYWERQDYLGFGISAASCFNEVRFCNTENIDSYIDKPINNFYEVEELTEDEISSERIFLGLRMLKGISKDLFIRDEWKKLVDDFIDSGLLKEENGTVSLTDRGLDLANRVFMEFV